MDSSKSPFESAKALCHNKEGLSESELVSLLEKILNSHPDVVYQEDGFNFNETLLHQAARRRSPEFCRLLIDVNPDLVRNANNREGQLPFQHACSLFNVETAKYLYHMYPVSINIPDERGDFPLHLFTSNYGTNDEKSVVELAQFLLKHDQGAVSTSNSGGYLPLHYAGGTSSLEIVKLIFNQYPEAIHVRVPRSTSTPLDIANLNSRSNSIRFFEHQLELERQAREERETDEHGQLPIHRAVQNRDESVGAIKLMMAANPASVGMTDSHDHTLLHLACKGGNLDTVKYIMGINQDSLKLPDLDGNLPLHVACMRGNCNLIPYIIEQSTFGVMLQNSAKQTPIELLLFESESDRDSMEYVEAVRCLFEVNPVDTLKCLMGKDEEEERRKCYGAINDCVDQGAVRKRKRA